MSNGGVDLFGRCLRCGEYCPSSGGCMKCGPYNEGTPTIIPSTEPTTILTDPSSQEYIRASGEVICEICKKEYYKHPWYRTILGYDGEPFLRKICSGIIVKL